MFKYKIGHHLSEETKELMDKMFCLKIIFFIELFGFSLLLSLLILPFLQPKPNFFIVFVPVLLLISLIYGLQKIEFRK